MISSLPPAHCFNSESVPVMTRILTLVLAAAGFALASCESVKSKKSESCCDSGSGASCCADGKPGASCCAEPGKKGRKS